MHITTSIKRRINYTIKDKQVCVYTQTTENNHPMQIAGFSPINFYNCIYITFRKKDFPNVHYPALVDGWREGQKRFNYDECGLARLPWHGGITYYKEEKDIETEDIIVIAGADYQHHGDEDYMEADNGELILKTEAENIINAFQEIIGK